ncbi:MAG: alanine racemase [Gracilimonas sp.]|nr:alanine racemase [Gracilimonas sp.]
MYPKLYLDLEIVNHNVQKMAEKCHRNDIEFRPHFKTHQSAEIGQIFREYDVNGITVSSLKMAEYFANDEWNDITIAFPANVLASSVYNKLASIIDLKTLVISEEVILWLDSEISHKMGLYIELDPDYGRSGVPIGDHSKMEKLLKTIDTSSHFYAAGFYCHAGFTYKTRSSDEIINLIDPIKRNKLAIIKSKYPDLPICFGDTPSCSVLNDFGPVDQLSPGNFVFYDWMQVEIGSCSPNEIAVYMECPVIEKFENRNEVLIHGGAVHFSKESIEINGIKSFGEPRLKHLSQETFLKSVSQEHGIVKCSSQVFDEINVGEMIQIFPIHSCLTADLMQSYETIDGKLIRHLSGIKK